MLSSYFIGANSVNFCIVSTYCWKGFFTSGMFASKNMTIVLFRFMYISVLPYMSTCSSIQLYSRVYTPNPILYHVHPHTMFLLQKPTPSLRTIRTKSLYTGRGTWLNRYMAAFHYFSLPCGFGTLYSSTHTLGLYYIKKTRGHDIKT